MWYQKEIIIKNKNRGFHLITDDIIQNFTELNKVSIGLLHLFIKHTSASLTVNENCSQNVRNDFENHFNKMVSENENYFTHTSEGPDDMTSHIKSSILGSSVSFPIKHGEPQFGLWQGIYLCEHRNNASGRKIFITLIGE